MIEKNIQIIRKSISDKSLQCGRTIDEIRLVAVSKQNSADSINEATKYDMFDFGENKAQELKQKSEICSNNIKWHFIGHLQTNKVKNVVPFAYLIHSVDSIKLAGEIDKRSANISKIQNVLLEVNTSGEESKFGMKVDDQVYELATFCKNAENINLMGLMTMAPYTSNEDIVRNSFKSLKNIFIKLNNEGFELRELSMGMSNDFEIAIEEGATILRIGTAIFGSRY
jgi:PLP dependent protein